ncbi:MAG: U32 family peptidase [Clostridiales bacterium]|nr:U32 family peptidase [Clostridiales bacterium]MDU3239290.1 U32 family peptidase [Clostridiales bacterium]
MKYFNVPADFKNATIDEYCKLNEKYSDSQVYEVYGQLTDQNFLGSGRPMDMIPKVDWNKLEKYVSYANSKNIQFNYTMNATCLGNLEFTREGIKKIRNFLEMLYEMGIHSLTIAIPALIEMTKLSKYDFEVKASTLCDILNANKAVGYKKLGADRIVVHESINRDFQALRSIREAFGPKVELITNVICHKNCIYRPFHQNQGSHDLNADEASSTYYPHRCMMNRIEGPDNYLKLNWIRPEDIHLYTGIGIEYFKIQGRHTVQRGNQTKTIECYMKEQYSGNLLDLLDNFSETTAYKINIDNDKLDKFIDPFYKIEGFCKNDCNHCNYCKDYARESIDIVKTEKIFSQARNFYHNYDSYRALIHEVF